MIKVELLRTAYITVTITGLFVKNFNAKNFRKLLNLRKSWIQRSLSSMVIMQINFAQRTNGLMHGSIVTPVP